MLLKVALKDKRTGVFKTNAKEIKSVSAIWCSIGGKNNYNYEKNVEDRPTG